MTRLIDADALTEKAFLTYQNNGAEIEEIMVVPIGAIDNAPTIEERPHGEWIAIKTRKPTEEEVQEYMNDPYFGIDDPADLMFFDCEMPKDGQEVLITTSWGHVCIDTYVHEYGAFEDHEDHEDVVAWMPLPKPYKAGDDV